MKTRDKSIQMRVEEELQRRNKELLALNRIAQLMSHTMNLKELLQYALEGVLEVMDRTMGAIYMVDEEACKMSCAVHKGLNEELTELIQTRSTISPHVSYTRKIVESDNVVVTLNLPEEVTLSSRPIFLRNNLKSAAGVPLKSKGKTLGVMIITSHVQRDFTTEDLMLLETISNQIGVAIENAKLFEKVSGQSAILESYITQITKATEEERRRIARDLHDDMAQLLAAMFIRVQGIIRDNESISEKNKQQLKQFQNEIKTMHESVRSFIHSLRPEVLDQLGLIPAIELLMDELINEDNLDAHIEIIGNQQRLSSDTEVTLFRIAQEAIRNIRRHSQATKVVIRIEFEPELIRLLVIDNGKGFKLPKALNQLVADGRLGLVSMSERSRLLNGNFNVRTGVGMGTTIEVEVKI